MTLTRTPGDSASGPRLAPAAVTAAVVAFVVIGVQQSLYGPAIPALRAAHDISAGAAGAALSVHFLGAVLGVLALPRSRRRGIADGTFLAAALALIASGCVGFLLAPGWPLALTAAFVAGVGFGGIDGGVNQVFTEIYTGDGGGHGMLNLLHGCFGVGAIAGPVAIGLLPGYGWAFVACAVGSVIVLPVLLGIRTGRVADPRRAGRRVLSLLGLALIGFFVLHVGLETGAGGWETTHLISTGLTASAAATATSGFWFAFTAVRFAVVPLCRRFPPRTIVIACTVMTPVAAVATLSHPLAPWAYGLLGVAVGPLFPTGLAWLGQLRPELIPTVVAVSMLGGVAFPPALGLAVESFGPGAVPWGLVGVALTTVATLALITGLASRPGPNR
ncbi:MFS transporter [Micromonospora pisi]|uniref:MFS transporter n=1 Tax=Micromonospora pisi TaxID=589240 RepID=UPI001477694D|nr:MFS transporter [Micromonospora pisi]